MKSDGAMNVLTINSGSSSIKFSLYSMGHEEEETVMLSGNIAGIGTAAGRFRAAAPDGTIRIEAERKFQNHVEALDVIMVWLGGSAEGRTLDAIGHRLVHGGSTY